MSKYYMGIDPGSKGFVTIINETGTPIVYFNFPKIKDKVDYSALALMFATIGAEYDIKHAVLEDVHAIQGSSAKGTFSFGFNLGFLEASLIFAFIPYTKIQPKKWQKMAWEGISLIKKASSTGKTQVTDTKAMSLMAAKRLFPKEDLRVTERSKIAHDGKVDSLLMANYCLRNFK